METKKQTKLFGRKFILFLISLSAIILLSFFNKDASSIIALFSAYCVGNVATKFSDTTKKEQRA